MQMLMALPFEQQIELIFDDNNDFLIFFSYFFSLFSFTKGSLFYSITLAACNNTNFPVHWRRKAGK